MFIIGKVVRPHGIKGEVKAEIITSFPEHFEHLSEIFIEQDEFVKLNVDKTRLLNNFVYLKFKEIQSRDEAENLRNKYLYIPDSELYPLKDDEFYHHQLMGFKVYDEEDSFIGVVKNIESYPVNDVLNVESMTNQIYLIPVIKDIIKNIDIESQKVTIHAIEGLLG